MSFLLDSKRERHTISVYGRIILKQITEKEG
jgi:hypothetical protein